MAAARTAQHGVVAGGEADVGQPQDLDVRERGLDRVGRAVGRAAVDDEPLRADGAEPLARGAQRRTARSRPVVGDDDDAEVRRGVHAQEARASGSSAESPGASPSTNRRCQRSSSSRQNRRWLLFLPAAPPASSDQPLDRVGAVLAARERAPVEQRLAAPARRDGRRSQAPSAEWKKPRLGLSMIASSTRPRLARLRISLRRPRQTRRESGRRVQNSTSVVVHERDADLERRRHRHLVEVQEHVVHEREARVEVQRLAERAAGRVRRAGGGPRRRSRPRRPGAGRPGRAARRARAAGRPGSSRAGARPGRPWSTAASPRASVEPAGAVRAAAPPRAAATAGARCEVGGERGDLVLAVAAEQLVGALARRARRSPSRARAG